ncbi:MAG: RluA family pseudouridine synthase [Bacteroidales bacterium]|nr:RluA family pseudouridine synthase [Bacteroidales bacterium]
MIDDNSSEILDLDDECFEQESNEQTVTEHFRFEADLGQELVRIDKFLDNRISGVSRNKIQEAAKAGYIFANGKVVKQNYRVHPKDIITVNMPGQVSDFKIEPENIPLDIVYEDDALIVVNKPAGMVVHPAHGNYTGTLVNALAWHLGENNNFGKDDIRPGLVHRIDKNTSGLLVIAKTEAAKVNLAKQFFYHTVNRKYQALVWGDFTNDYGTFEGNIGRNPRDRKSMCVFPPDSNIGKPAITHYKVLERFGYVTLVECKLETGRTHQIRVHFKSNNHPLFNDDVYGGDRLLRGTTFTKYRRFVDNCFEMLPRQALHAKTLEFIHPTTGKTMSFDSELPSDMVNVIEKWRIYSTAGRTWQENDSNL